MSSVPANSNASFSAALQAVGGASVAGNPSGDRASAPHHPIAAHATHELDPRLAPADGPLDPIDTADQAALLPDNGRRRDTDSLTHKTAAGLAWLLAQAVGSKLVGFFSQLILAALLIPDQFGIYSFALSLATIINVVQHAGVGEILIHRQARRDLWTNPAVWLSAITGVIAMLCVLVAAPIAAAVRPEPLVGQVVALVSLTALFSALAIVPTALLQIDMRQRALGVVNFVMTLVGAVVSVLLAWRAEPWGVPVLGGPIALALGAVAASAWQTAALWWLARPELRASPQLRRWRYMLADSFRLLAAGLINTLTRHGATLVLGVLHSVHVVGIFSFGFLLSLQSITLLQTSLNTVLFPALSKLQDDPQRLLSAYIRSSRLLAIIGMPACFMQAAAAEPVMRLIFAERWLDAVPVVQWLSIGMAFAMLGSINTSLIKAQGRFGLLVHVTIAYGLTYVAAVALGGWLGEHVAMSVAICVYMVIWGPLGAFIAARSVGGTVRDIFRIYGSPGIMAAISVGLGWWVGSRFPAATRPEYALQAVIMSVVAAAAHALIVRFFAKDTLVELLHRLDASAPPRVGEFVRASLRM